jgi:hypothetical protein
VRVTTELEPGPESTKAWEPESRGKSELDKESKSKSQSERARR